MINLIQNEWKKLFGRPIFLIPFVVCLGCFVLFFWNCRNNYRVSPIAHTTPETVQTIMEQLKADEDPDSRYQIHKYQYILDTSLQIPVRGWQMTALNEAFGYYQKQIQEQDGTPHEIASCYRYFKLLCQAVRSNSSNDYLQLLTERVQSDISLSATEKYYYTQYYSYLMSQNIEPDTGDWRQEAATDLLESTLSLLRLEEQASDMDSSDYDRDWQDAYNRQAVARYRLEQGIPLLITDKDFGDSMFWKSLFSSRKLLPVLLLPMIFLLSGIIAGETNQKNLNLLFSLPVSRIHYFGAKFWSTMFVCTIWILLVYICNIAMACLLFGMEDLQASTLFVRDGMVNAYSALFLLLKQYFLICLPLYVSAAFCLFLSSVTSHTWLAAAGVLVCTAGSWWLGQQALPTYLSWISYSAIGSLDVLSILKGSAAWGQTLPYAFCMLLLHFLLFTAGAGIFFCKKQL